MLGMIRDAVDREISSIVEDASSLIRIPSRNPPGEERRCAEYIYSRLRELGLDAILLYEPYPDRPQVIAYPADHRPEESNIILDGHMDTVPEGSMDEWSVDPFSGIIRDGCIYGRGAVDMKSALAVMMHIWRIVSISGADAGALPLLCFAIGEERAEPGTVTMLRQIRRMGIDGIRYGIVMEPTSLRVSTSQMGAMWIRVRVRGRAVHASMPDAGINAIVKACRVVNALESYAADIAKRNGHDRNNSSTSRCLPRCSVTMIAGGVKENILPGECSITIDRRIAPDEDRDYVLQGLRSLLDLHAGDYTMHIIAERRPVSICSSALAERLGTILASLGIDSRPWCFPGSTDNEHVVYEGIESIVWGPGNIEQAHAADEHISIEEVRLSAYALASLLTAMRDS